MDCVYLVDVPALEDLDARWLGGGLFDRDLLLYLLLLRAVPRHHSLHLPSKITDIHWHQLWLQLHRGEKRAEVNRVNLLTKRDHHETSQVDYFH